MSADIDALNDRQTALEAKIDEANATLSQLATTVLDLRNLIGNTQRLEEAVRHAATRAEKMLNSLAAAEDAADDALAAPPAEPPAA